MTETMTAEQARARLGIGGDPTETSAFAGSPPSRRSAWSILPEVFDDVCDFLAGRWSRQKFEARLEAARALDAPAPGAGQGARGAVAILPLHGLITPRSSFLAMLFGGAGGGLLGFRAAFREAMAADEVESIILDIDSPGGLTDQVPETAAMIREARGQGKRIVAHANTMAASAAYWIAAQADEIVVSPSGQTGSIGVILFHEDVSGMEEQFGIQTTIISAGKFKAEANPYEPLSREARQSLQAYVDQVYDMFVDDIAAGRGAPANAVRSGYGQGRLELAADSVQFGLADRIESFEATLLRMGAPEEESEAPDEDPSLEEPEETVPPPPESEAEAHRRIGRMLLPRETTRRR